MMLPYSEPLTGLYDYYSPLADEPDCDIVEPEAVDAFCDLLKEIDLEESE